MVGGFIPDGHKAPRPQYIPETFSLSKIDLTDLKNQIKQMPPQELSELKIPDSEMLLNMIISSAEMEPAKKELTRHLEEVKVLAEGNVQLHSLIQKLAE